MGLWYFNFFFNFSRKNFASFKQQKDLETLSVWSQCLKGILETVLALGRKTCFDSSELSQAYIWVHIEPLAQKKKKKMIHFSMVKCGIIPTSFSSHLCIYKMKSFNFRAP